MPPTEPHDASMLPTTCDRCRVCIDKGCNDHEERSWASPVATPLPTDPTAALRTAAQALGVTTGASTATWMRWLQACPDWSAFASTFATPQAVTARIVTRENARWLGLLLSPSHDPTAQATVQGLVDDWFDALASQADDPSEHDHLHIGTAPRADLPPVWSCMGCGQATNVFVTGSLVHPEDGLCERCVAAIRQADDPSGPDVGSVDWWEARLAARNGSNRGMAEFVVETIRAAVRAKS